MEQNFNNKDLIDQIDKDKLEFLKLYPTIKERTTNRNIFSKIFTKG